MGSILLNPSQPSFSDTLLAPLKNHKVHHHASASRNHRFKCNSISRTSSFHYRSSASVPLHEFPSASFNEYIEDKGRVIRSIFSESASQQLNKEEWRVKMSQVEALFLKCHPVIHITAKCKSEFHEYPPHIPHHITKYLEFQVTRVEFPDLNGDYMPPHFNMNAKGVLYLEKKGMHNWMKNHLDVNFNLDFPPLLDWVPHLVLQTILQSVLKNYVDDINNGSAVRLLADYNLFKRKKPKNLV
ncbi:hypothetical protein PHAVU_004G029700 [Phaseolus vulgaris]|uniref:Uncharacterized protein n=1 Tax=Phaseolus vulgaris TaxID=3885 RepID=V7C1K3_PHAVU|nr:hypothetical protein PHAVU_004G029700g [Phaseolus vulgaris]ESW23233.1 hypothetical protein PHAVU_004G029700g [Phaseolus vulgaris]